MALRGFDKNTPVDLWNGIRLVFRPQNKRDRARKLGNSKCLFLRSSPEKTRGYMAQQVSTHLACQLAERAKSAHPSLTAPSPANVPNPITLRAIGLSQRRAECCAHIVRRSDEILAMVGQGHSWEHALAGIKGIGPWTIAVFRIMVLRDPDVLPLRDVGLQRAITNVYGRPRNVERLGKKWRPYRSVACWYLWRTLGNQQLG